MHPTLIMAMADEVKRERQESQVRSLSLANRRDGLKGSRAADGLAVRLIAGLRLRPRLS